MKRKLVAELSILVGELGATIKRIPAGVDSPALADAELVVRDCLANLRRAKTALLEDLSRHQAIQPVDRIDDDDAA